MRVEDVRFKAKIKDSNILVSVTKIDFSEKKVHIGIDKDLWEDDPEDIEFPHFMNDFKNVEALLPYTGFKDKNGEPIYEGDILEISKGVKKFNGETCRKLIVCLHNGRFLATNNIKTVGNVIGGGISLKNIFDKNAVTIVGNYFENPELLKKEVE